MKMLHAFMGVLLLFTSATTAMAGDYYDFSSKNAKIVEISSKNLDKNDQRDLVCLALNIYHEARGSTYTDQVSVGYVTLNRSQKFDQTICNIVYRNNQFKWTGSKIESYSLEKKAWGRSLMIAYSILFDEEPNDPTHGALYFHERSQKPTWAKMAFNTHVYGNHIFFNLVN
jgi:spore germination cell wall hydrolase CwlJ-like protein